MRKQIHHTVVSHQDRYVLDPEFGAVKRREQVFAKSDVEQIKHGDDSYEVQPDGSFVVPAELADFMLKQPGWNEGPSPFAPEPVTDHKPRASARKLSAV
jgi:hypothetical protein